MSACMASICARCCETSTASTRAQLFGVCRLARLATAWALAAVAHGDINGYALGRTTRSKQHEHRALPPVPRAWNDGQRVRALLSLPSSPKLAAYGACSE